MGRGVGPKMKLGRGRCVGSVAIVVVTGVDGCAPNCGAFSAESVAMYTGELRGDVFFSAWLGVAFRTPATFEDILKLLALI